MRIKFQLISYAFSLFFVFNSCKVENKKKKINSSSKETITKKEVVEDPYFYLVVKAKFSKWDKLHMYYLSGHLDKYSGERKIAKEVIPNGKFQEIIFELKEEVYPFNIRLDLGENKEQSLVMIQECVLHYGNESFKIKGKDLNKYFHFNKGVKISSDSLTFKLKTFKRGQENIYDPFIRGNQKLNNILGTKL